jgi:hypothetical protein
MQIKMLRTLRDMNRNVKFFDTLCFSNLDYFSLSFVCLGFLVFFVLFFLGGDIIDRDL